MATLKAKKLNAALAKAKKVGRAEVSVTIDGLPLVLQNLAPSEYEQIIEETEDLQDAAYMHAYQIGHICRSIIEIDGVDLREIKYIEDEVPTGGFLISGVVKTASKAQQAKETLAKLGVDVTVVEPGEESESKSVTFERHEWVRQRIATWGREAILVAMKKFGDVLMAGEAKATEGVTFSVAEESYADRYRRLLAEVKALESEIPPDMVNNILQDAGYLQKTSAEEMKAAETRMREFQAEQLQANQEEELEEEEAPPPPPVRAKPAPATEPEPEASNDELSANLKQMMQRRQPLNRTAIAAPITAEPPTQAAAPTPRPAPGVPTQLAQAAKTRSDSIAALEAQLDPNLMNELDAIQGNPPPVVPRELAKPSGGLNGADIVGILDKPPAVGINPRFKPRT